MASADTASPRAAKPRKRASATATKKTSAAKRSSTATRSSTAKSSYAERAILIPVGAALIARDRLVASVNDTFTSYSSTSAAQAQLRKFERRGATARKRLEREVRKARTSVERELRKRRQESAELADRVQERIQSLV